MHIFQPIRNTGQLNGSSVRLPQDRVTTYKLDAVYMLIPLDKLVDVSVLHPLGNKCKPVFIDCHSEQRQDVWVPEVLPGDPLSAGSLQAVYPGRYNDVCETLTLRMRSRSLVTYIRTTLIATRRPSYIPCDMLAMPPDSTSTAPSEQSGMCMDSGITRCRLHALQSSLNNFSRSRPDMVWFSRRCGRCYAWGGGGGEKLKNVPCPFHQRALESHRSKMLKIRRT